ncbi:hypothetical protein Mal4_04360 [Maioricimonas rarisocia]|uniref:Uncharacterized protein n=1 Tax=Maioricimonas rarisocia TaxID=2528026 RepID=A0A517Z108_9PLAN|nr:hypothetical protein [Maioricimonas rarisocia]QDU36153.1 hypothetical protein Mal4_04360 [Maioricimonas rarisocia]
MKASRLTVLALAGLMTAFVATDVAEAAKARSPVERRLRPGRGYWQAKSAPTTRTYRSPVVQPRQLQAQQVQPQQVQPQQVQPRQVQTQPAQPKQVQRTTSPYRPVYSQPRRSGWRLFRFR